MVKLKSLNGFDDSVLETIADEPESKLSTL